MNLLTNEQATLVKEILNGQKIIDNRSLTERRIAAEDRAEAKRLIDEDAA
jgi:hypothetical protein